MKQAIEINELNFEAEVLGASTPFLLDFSASWCGPCKALAPVLEGLAGETRGRLRVGVIDIDAAPELARRFGVRGAPTLVLFEGGRERRRQVGASTKARLLALAGLVPDASAQP